MKKRHAFVRVEGIPLWVTYYLMVVVVVGWVLGLTAAVFSNNARMADASRRLRQPELPTSLHG